MIRLGTLTAGTMGFCTVAVLGLMMGKEWEQNKKALRKFNDTWRMYWRNT